MVSNKIKHEAQSLALKLNPPVRLHPYSKVQFIKQRGVGKEWASLIRHELVLSVHNLHTYPLLLFLLGWDNLVGTRQCVH